MALNTLNNGAVYAVEVRIPEEIVFSDRMQAMRQWLDHQRFEPTTFRTVFGRDSHVVRLDFTVHDEARAFAAAFDGQVR